MQIHLNGTTADVTSYVSNIDRETGQTTYSFYFPSATGPGAKEFLSNPKNLTLFVIGLTSTGAYDDLTLGNFTSFVNLVSPGFAEIPLGSLPTSTGDVLALQSPPACLLDTIALVALTSSVPIHTTDVQAEYRSQTSPTTLSITAASGGWGILQVAETYSPSWGLQGTASTSPHFAVNLGLNGWLVQLDRGQTVTAVLRANGVVFAGMILAGVFLPILGVSGWLGFRSRLGSRLGTRAGKPNHDKD
jgi:hypothetical protein